MQRELRREIRSKISPPSLQHTMTPDTFDSMPYLCAVRNDVCGYMLPVGLPVGLSPWALQRAAALWGPNTREFKAAPGAPTAGWLLVSDRESASARSSPKRS